jgi:GxxExxY protein
LRRAAYGSDKLIPDFPRGTGYYRMTLRRELIESDLTHSIVGAFYEVYNELGYGLLESVYASGLERELRARGHQVGREVLAIVRYKGEEIAWQRLDMLVDGKVVIEIKATEELPRFARRQLLNYLKATNLEVGLILHFGPEAKFYRLISAPQTRPAIRGHPGGPG